MSALTRRLSGFAARAPWPLVVLILFVASRVVSTLIIEGVARQQPAGPWGGPHPGYLHFISTWDSEWYRRIVEHGYPSSIPRAADGAARENAWAFYPLFPALVKGVSFATGGGWMPAAAIAALLAGLAAALSMNALFRLILGPTASLWATASVLFSPLGALFQIPYAEGLHVALLAATLLLISARRFEWAIPLVVLTGLSRPTAAPMALAVILVAAYWFSPRHRGRLSQGEALALVGLILAALATSVAWPLIAWWGTGEANAYTDTETVWRGGELVLFRPWADRAIAMFGEGWWLALIVLLVSLVALFASRAVRAAGVAVWGWCLSYVLYLLAVFDPQTSTFRLLLPLFPLAAAVVVAFDPRAAEAGGGTRRGGGRGGVRHGADAAGLRPYRILLLVLGVLLQIVWVYWLWRWTPLPGGGDYPP